jgi:fluoroacetyl-CoA thioesterase
VAGLVRARSSILGAAVVAVAQLIEVDGRRLVFNVEAREDTRVVAAGRIERVVVVRAEFLARLG